ncbi:MFS transporter [Deinococcus roseus]|uniref:MFS transporter n=1 Tax=Deinococcus roseus TaxID=392414 RepID=A0ABQ2CZ81_9DEIO|nr:MFS transporter [Deinococcus roseus]GGJ28457.1 MFS transporter [Deinococcus roseus]
MSSARPVQPLQRTFASLKRYRNYRLLFQGQVISQIGTKLQDAAQAWVVLQLTQSPAEVGLMTACLFGPYAVFGLLGGPLTDRLDARKTMVVTQIIAMLCAAMLALLSFTGHLTVLWMDGIALMRGLVLVLNNPARQVLIRQSVERSDLSNAVALNSTIFNSARILGPSLGGVLLASVGAGWCFLINALAFLPVVWGLIRMNPEELFPLKKSVQKESLIKQLNQGLCYAFQTPELQMPFIVLLVVSLFCLNFNVSLPIVASHLLHTDAVGFGLISAVFGGGALLGALTSATLSKPRTRTMLAGALGLGLSLVLVGFSSQALLAGIGLFLTGFCFTIYTTTTNASVQLKASDEYQGRIASLYAYIFTGTNPLGALLIGHLASAGNARLSFWLPGLLAVVAAGLGHLAHQKRKTIPAN